VRLSSDILLPVWILGLGTLAIAREKAGVRGLFVAAAGVALVVSVLLALDPSSTKESYLLLVAPLVGGVAGLLTRSRHPPWTAFLIAVALSLLAFLWAIFTIFAW
jgi:drug/metabolite transporter (DMT)-like permease